jgi:hypothetical protein
MESIPWLEANRQLVLREQTRAVLQQHLAGLNATPFGKDSNSMSFRYDSQGNLAGLRDVFG